MKESRDVCDLYVSYVFSSHAIDCLYNIRILRRSLVIECRLLMDDKSKPKLPRPWYKMNIYFEGNVFVDISV